MTTFQKFLLRIAEVKEIDDAADVQVDAIDAHSKKQLTYDEYRTIETALRMTVNAMEE